MRPPLRALLLCCLLATLPLIAAPLQVVYPGGEAGADPRFAEIRELLTIALQKTEPRYGPFVLKASAMAMTESRAQAELERGGDINVMWSSTSNYKEHALLPIRIDLYKGLLGYRIALIDGRRQKEFDRIRTLADLSRFKIGQGIGWGDISVYEANGLTVTAASYNNLFAMVSQDRFDMFPRGVGEVFPEYEAWHARNPNLAVERHLLFYYTWPYYLFCNRRDHQLAKRLRDGLQQMREDGSFDAIFWRYHRAAIQEAQLTQRRVIRLSNPLLPVDTPLQDLPMWFDPQRDHPPAAR
ncbi:amino acid ABC transporter substrate-binding protein [Xenophilus sp. AP218F]|nr:amino acid ABC transporter substrate-binding protein [Xenophilus sp. AP218F]